MKVQIAQLTRKSLVIDFKGIGRKLFKFSAKELNEIIQEDIKSNYSIAHLKTLVEIEEGIYTATNNHENTLITVRIFLKNLLSEEIEEMKEILPSYLQKTFIEGIN